MLAETKTDQRELRFKDKEVITLEEFDALFIALMHRNWEVDGKMYNLALDEGFKMGYNNRKTSLGYCKFRSRRIEISMDLLKHNLDKPLDWEDTIRHEIAHGIDVCQRGRSAHDARWKAICVQVGANPQRCHEGFLEKPKGKYTASCPTCGRENQKYRKPKGRMSCGQCSGGRFNPQHELVIKQNY